jgi:TRAP-type C4-dicarboxylate transport system permease small subunit
MVSILKALDPITATLSRIALVAACLGVLAMTVLVFWSIFGRYVMNNTPTWTEPAVLLLMSWFILLGSAVGVRERSHMGFDLGLAMAPPRLRFALRVITEVLILGFGIAMLVYGAQLAAGNWAGMTPMLGISQGWDLVPMAIGGALIALFSFERLLAVLAGVDTAFDAAAASANEI